MRVLVAYDIADDRKRERLARALAAFGDRVQFSVFLCHVDARRLRALLHRAVGFVDPAVDRLRIERLPQDPILAMGRTADEPCREWVL
ncbi:MAG: CRISPR-associated endonuclease Cas2 [Fimbriimonadaceae bacterium]|nr:CRISPR-associated endonuclease Cas2 [Fimbriimonadaceae bacterium]